MFGIFSAPSSTSAITEQLIRANHGNYPRANAESHSAWSKGASAGDEAIHKDNRWALRKTQKRTLERGMEERRREKCAQRDGGMPTVSRDVAVAFFFFCPVRHRALHHRRVFLQVPSPTTIPCPVLPPGPPAASLIYWFSAARRAINHGNGGRRWLGCGDGKERKEGRMDRSRKWKRRGWRWARQPRRTADRLLMVFVSPRPVPVQGADSLGCYIKELWACRGPT